VSKPIESGALDLVNKALGIGGAGSAAETLLDDANVDQVLDVAPLIRRGLVPAATEGIFRGVLRTNHAIGDSQQAVWSPYDEQLSRTIAPYTPPISDEFDIWLLRACVVVTTVSGTATCSLNMQNVRQGFGANQVGSATIVNSKIPLAFWDILHTVHDTTFMGTGNRNTEPWKKIDQRLPRLGETATRVQIFFMSEASGGPSAYDCNFLFGIFPVGLGQDAVL